MFESTSVLIAVVTLFASSAFSSDYPFFKITDQAGKVMAASTSGNQRISQENWTGGTGQLWRLVPNTKGAHQKIVNRLTGEALEPTPGCARKIACSIRQARPSGKKQQQWSIYFVDGGATRFVNRLSCGVLETDGASVQVGLSDGDKRQEWNLTVVDSGPGPFFDPDPDESQLSIPKKTHRDPCNQVK
jgi:hypothetical protein